MNASEIEAKIKAKKQELFELEQFYSAAWEMYGSELCANEMTGNLRKLRQEIRALETQQLDLPL
jgi:hypothetical protein